MVTINASKAEQTLKKNLKDDADIVKGIGAVFKLAYSVGAGDPFSLAKGLSDLTEATASALSGSSALISRLTKEQEKTKDTKASYERFSLLFFVTCQRCYIEALVDYLRALGPVKTPATNDAGLAVTEKEGLRTRLEVAVANLNQAEVPFKLGIDPMAPHIPLFEAFDAWLASALEYLGYPSMVLPTPVDACSKNARQRFRVWVAQDTDEAKWVRNYLALPDKEDKSEVLTETLSAFHDLLTPWTEPLKKNEARRAELWREYREALARLPDLKDSMFNEQFGVRKVFVAPLVTYQIAGAGNDTGKPDKIPNINKLLAALLSTRVKSDDLIVLCGGPGSGKSTLCRMIASNLASNAHVYPVFLRLRRLKEGADIANFIEESLRKEGLIEKTSDLKDIPNLIIILDGFDELVMASRTRLRQFFNALREDHASGILRNSRIIVSGRDTLFPKGEGLPTGSHVLNLLPFDHVRVAAWAEKWRKLETDGKSESFRPELLLPEKELSGKKSPLHYLLTWPLTLHLVARVHTSGNFTIGKDGCDHIEKAYLYRSILADTATRQLGQAEGKGRLDSRQMRRFLQSVAWEMHSRSVDCMDIAEVRPLLKQFFPGSTDGDLDEVAEVAIVNSPELTKGEETGFEFVHKSFAEYLAAEHISMSIEEATLKIDSSLTDEQEWRMSDRDAASALAKVFGGRLLTDEVQEMLEPMLGGLKAFLGGSRVGDRIDPKQREDGLTRIITRFESLLRDAINGKWMSAVSETQAGKELSPLETYGNFCAGLLLVGSACARTIGTKDGVEKLLFNVNHFENALWRLVSILLAGGIVLDDQISHRLFTGTTCKGGQGGLVGDGTLPYKLTNFKQISGYRADTEAAIKSLLNNLLAGSLVNLLPDHLSFSYQVRGMPQLRSNLADLFDMAERLKQLGAISDSTVKQFQHSWRELRDVSELLRTVPPGTAREHIFPRLTQALSNSHSDFDFQRLLRELRVLSPEPKRKGK